MDEETSERAAKLGFRIERRGDDWFLLGELGEEVGAFEQVEALQAFLTWLENRRQSEQ